MRVAGVQVGDIGKVELEDGVAVVELELEPEYKGLIREDATALLRTRTGLKDMFIEIDPGNGKPLEDGDRIRVAKRRRGRRPRRDPVGARQRHARLPEAADRRAPARASTGAGRDLRETFKRFGPLHRDLDRVTSAIARRRENLRRLVNRYGLLTTRARQGGPRHRPARAAGQRRARRRSPRRTQHLGRRLEAAGRARARRATRS